ncbi:hypothetical protein KXD40_005761 [Peronospora effusa]|uniref:DNL-type domain-containing protein n=1 Tax=Peronospora effusa TaxID=542832 RepID=A0A3M6VHK4_9STRA|nr:hypothetical protein DD238_004125 [Peronospora effusa]RQM09244.1 hypothetical protein DD237_007419 [Peronospora effusa]UIZ27409.1 hypothetical protein KXD40_005761 [Peronospora effusa]CAI5728112.1 unnamed protein product [Peronospora effusa]
MWCRALVRCSSNLRSSRAASKSLTCHSFRLNPLSIRLRTCSDSSQQFQSYSRFFTTQNEDDNDALSLPATTSNSITSATDYSGAPGVESPGDKFVMVYTCSVCETRSAKTISKHGYYKGVVLVRCPKCENLHLIADRLGWFEDDSTDVESLLQQKNEKVRFVTVDDVLELTENDILGNKS